LRRSARADTVAPTPGVLTLPAPRTVPPLDATVPLPDGPVRLGEPGEEREVVLGGVLIGRFPVVNAHVAAFAAATRLAVAPDLAARLTAPELADHPATGLAFGQARAFCAWAAAELGRPVRLPTADEWEAAARGTDARTWPWGDVFDPERCNASESGWGWTVPVTAHPDGAGPTGAEQLAGNVWEWVDADAGDGWVQVRGGSYLDCAWGVRSSRAQPADPARPTATTGLRIAITPTLEVP